MSKSSRSLFWIDSGELAALARSALGTAPESAPLPVPSIASAAAELREPSVPAVVSLPEPLPVVLPVTAPTPAPEPEPAETLSAAPPAFVPPTGGFEERLTALLRWLESAGATGSFVADHEGLPLVRRGASEEIVAASSALANLWGSLNASLRVPLETSLEVAFAGAGHLYVVPFVTGPSRLVLGFETQEPLLAVVLDTIRAAVASMAELTPTETLP